MDIENKMSALYNVLPAFYPSNTVCPLNQFGLLRVTGDDGEDFLNRLVTCQLEPQKKQPQLCALCNPKGRVLACFTVFYKDQNIYLMMPHELVDIILQRLKMYVLTAKVELSNASNDLVGMGYIGSRPAQISDNNILLLQAPGLLPRYFIYASKPQIEQAWQQARIAGYDTKYDTNMGIDDHWHYANIACGIPHIYPSTIEKLTPQMINLDLIDAVSFSKGCYPGQEVVARTHYLGKAKRRCYLFSATDDSDRDVEGVGASVYHPDYDEACGIVVDNCNYAPGCSLGLISIRTEVADKPGLYVKIQNDEVLPLQIEQRPSLP